MKRSPRKAHVALEPDIPEGFVNARTAARFVGYEPGEGPARRDPEMRAFYAFVDAARVPKHRRGERCLVFRLSELEAAITTADHEGEASSHSLTRMEALAREHALRVIGSGRSR